MTEEKRYACKVPDSQGRKEGPTKQIIKLRTDPGTGQAEEIKGVIIHRRGERTHRIVWIVSHQGCYGSEPSGKQHDADDIPEAMTLGFHTWSFPLSSQPLVS